MSGFAASFDCAKARSASERIVCKDPELSAKDDQLAALVKAAKQRAPNARAFQREQDNAWTVRQKCKDVACVSNWYAARIASLSAPASEPAKAEPVVTPKPAPVPVKPAPVAAPKSAPVPAKPVAMPQPAPRPEPVSVAKPAPLAVKSEPVVASRPAPVVLPNPVPLVLPNPAQTVLPQPAAVPPPKAVPAPVMAAAPAPQPAPAASPASPADQFQAVGEKLGFAIPATKADFLARYAKTGGQCGVSKHLASLKAVARSAASDCWSGSQCPAYSKDLNCKVVRTAFDDSGRLVLFMATLNTLSSETAKSTRDMGVVVRKFSGMSGSSPIVRKVHSGHLMTLSGFDGQLRFDADVMAAQGEQQIGMFWVSLR